MKKIFRGNVSDIETEAMQLPIRDVHIPCHKVEKLLSNLAESLANLQGLIPDDNSLMSVAINQSIEGELGAVLVPFLDHVQEVIERQNELETMKHANARNFGTTDVR